jgi:hypothetical protein
MAEELLKELPKLSAFGVEWVRKWLVLRDRLIEIAKVMRRFPWMVDVIKQRPMSILHPYMVEVCDKGWIGDMSLAKTRRRRTAPKTAQ